MRCSSTAILGLLTSWTLFGCAPGFSDVNLRFIPSADVKALVDEAAAKGKPNLVLLVDPRSEADFAAGHLPGAVNVAPIQFGEKVPPAIARAGTVIVYGADPGDALARGMAKRLLESGLSSVKLFAGGIGQWKANGLPLETGAANAVAPEAK